MINSGFWYLTEIEHCSLNQTNLRKTKLVLYPSANHMNHTYFYENYLKDEFWDCNYTEVGMVRQHTLHNLESGAPYRLRVRQYDNATRTIATEWSERKVLTTLHSKNWKQHEWVTLFLRGTGLNNHNSSIFQIDSTVLLDHAFFMGFYLAVLDRRDLSLAFSGFFNTSVVPEGTKYDLNTQSYVHFNGQFQTWDDFGNANQMAQRIKMYDQNFFIVVISQYSWEQQFSKELGEVLASCGALNVLEFAQHYFPRFSNSTAY